MSSRKLATVGAPSAMFVASAATVFCFYNDFRTMGTSLGISASGFLLFAAIAAPFAIATGIWFPLAVLGDRFRHFRRAMRRHRDGMCAACGYDMGRVPSPVCPECGRPIARPSHAPVRWQACVFTVMVFVAGVLCGAGVAEMLVDRDEARFRREAAAWEAAGAAGGTYRRARAWPNRGGALGYRPGMGFFAND